LACCFNPPEEKSGYNDFCLLLFEPVLSTFAEQFVFCVTPSAENGCGG